MRTTGAFPTVRAHCNILFEEKRKVSEASQSAAAVRPDHVASGRLQGRRILVTGAGSGIGARTARLFADEGASLALLDLNAEGLAATAAAAGGHAYAVDVTDEAAVSRAVEQAAAAMGGIDGVVNAAGIFLRAPISEVPVDRWRRVLDINLTGMYAVIRSSLPWLRQARGSTVVTIASAQGLLPNAPEYTAYAASKGGVVALSRALAAELAPEIRVNCICPGMVDTPMANGLTPFLGNYALRRMADPLEIALAILFLTGPDSSFVTGAAIAVDGGRSFH